MELSLKLVSHGLKVSTFLNTDFIHKRIVNALSEEDNVKELINVVSIPDEMEPWEDRNNIATVHNYSLESCPESLSNLLKTLTGQMTIKASQNSGPTLVGTLGWKKVELAFDKDETMIITEKKSRIRHPFDPVSKTL
ncbi:hypothetical protein AgCh_015200 [Apium graveolens]